MKKSLFRIVFGVTIIAIFSAILIHRGYNTNDTSSSIITQQDVIKRFNENPLVFSKVAEYVQDIEGNFSAVSLEGQIKININNNEFNKANEGLQNSLKSILINLDFEEIRNNKNTVYFEMGHIDGGGGQGIAYSKDNKPIHITGSSVAEDWEQITDKWYYYSWKGI